MGGCCLPLLSGYMPWAPQRRHAPSGPVLHSLSGQESSQVPPTMVVSAHVWLTTLPTQCCTWERVPDLWTLMLAGVAVHLLPWCLLGRALPHLGVPGDGASVVGDTEDLCPPQSGWSQPHPLVSTNWPLCVLPLQPTTSVGATSRPHLPWYCISGSLVVSLQQRSPDTSTWWDWVTRPILKWHPFGMESPRTTVGRSQCPSSLLGGSLPGDLLIWPQAPLSGKSPKNLLLDAPKPGPPDLVAARALPAARASVDSAVVMTSGATHPLHPFFQECSCCEDPLMGIPCEDQHLLIQPTTCGNKLLVIPVIPISKSQMRTHPGGII